MRQRRCMIRVDRGPAHRRRPTAPNLSPSSHAARLRAPPRCVDSCDEPTMYAPPPPWRRYAAPLPVAAPLRRPPTRRLSDRQSARFAGRLPVVWVRLRGTGCPSAWVLKARVCGRCRARCWPQSRIWKSRSGQTHRVGSARFGSVATLGAGKTEHRPHPPMHGREPD